MTWRMTLYSDIKDTPCIILNWFYGVSLTSGVSTIQTTTVFATRWQTKAGSAAYLHNLC